MSGQDDDDHEEPSSKKDITKETLKLAANMQQSVSVTNRKKPKDSYAFWNTQPVPQFRQRAAEAEDGPIDEPKTVADVRQEPYALPDRFNYSPEFLRWALQPPGYRPEWHVGVRVKANHKLVGFITAIPADVRINAASIHMVEINFLCVHKKLRSKRLAPVLIKEITRRVNLHNIWQAAYTAGVVLPKPVAETRYWHRSLNPKKLIDIGFSRLQPRMTMARTIKFYKLPDVPLTQGLRPMTPADVPSVTNLLNSYLARFKLAPIFTEPEVEHWFRPQEDVVEAYVVVGADGVATDLLSFYSLPSTILGNPEYNLLRAAYMYYTVPGQASLQQLIQDAMVLARNKGYDVFNALDILQNTEFLKDQKFGIGDGNLQYYLYNWRVAATMLPADVGLILL